MFGLCGCETFYANGQGTSSAKTNQFHSRYVRQIMSSVEHDIRMQIAARASGLTAQVATIKDTLAKRGSSASKAFQHSREGLFKTDLEGAYLSM